MFFFLEKEFDDVSVGDDDGDYVIEDVLVNFIYGYMLDLDFIFLDMIQFFGDRFMLMIMKFINNLNYESMLIIGDQCEKVVNNLIYQIE